MTFPAGHRIFDDGGFTAKSWLIPPYRRASGAACLTPVRAFESGAAASRERYTADPQSGAQPRHRLLPVPARRLQGTRTRLIARSMSGRGDGV